MGLDTVSGFLRIVVNGVKVVDEEKMEFRNTTAWRPRSLAGKILVFKEKNSNDICELFVSPKVTWVPIQLTI